MPSQATFVGSARGKPTTASFTVTYPTGTQSGDMVMIFAVTGGGTLTVPSGWTSLSTRSDEHLFYKVAGSETSVVITCNQAMDGQYGWLAVTYRNITNGTPLRGTANTGASLTLPAYTPTNTAATFAFFIVYNNNTSAATDVFTAPAGWVERYQDASVTQTGNAILADRLQETGGSSAPASTLTPNINGGANYWAYVSFEVLDSAPPNTTITTADNTKFDPRLPFTVNWNYSDVEGAVQAQSQAGWRVAGGTWTDMPAQVGTSTAYTFAANTFPDESNVEVRVRTHDGTAWGNWDTVPLRSDSWLYVTENTPLSTTQVPITQAANYQVEVRTSDEANGFGPWATTVETDPWIYGSEVPSSAETGTIDTSSWTVDDYEVQVETADAEYWSPWSDSYVVPGTNVKTLRGGSFEATPRYVLIGGAWLEHLPQKF